MPNPNGNPSSLKPWGPDNPPPRSPGRPRKRPMTEEYDELVREDLPEKERKALNLPPGTTWGRAMALARAREALTRGGTLAAKEIADRIEGKPTQRVEIHSPEDRGWDVKVTFEMPAKLRPIEEKIENKVIEAAVVNEIARIEEEEENKTGG